MWWWTFRLSVPSLESPSVLLAWWSEPRPARQLLDLDHFIVLLAPALTSLSPLDCFFLTDQTGSQISAPNRRSGSRDCLPGVTPPTSTVPPSSPPPPRPLTQKRLQLWRVRRKVLSIFLNNLNFVFLTSPYIRHYWGEKYHSFIK